MSKVIGNVEVSNNITVSGKNVITSANTELFPDSSGDLTFGSSQVFDGEYGELCFYDSNELIYSKKLVNYVRIVDSNNELSDEQSISSIGSIYDISTPSDYKTWNFDGSSWISTTGINLDLGQMYCNTRTTKVYYNNNSTNFFLVAGQTFGNNPGNVPDMSYYGSLLSPNGYQLLPSGFKIQWAWISTTPGNNTITLPIPFDSVMIGGLINDYNSNGWTTNECYTGKIDFSLSTLSTVVISSVDFSAPSSSLQVTNSMSPDIRILVWGF
jgi:hypothetical protein